MFSHVSFVSIPVLDQDRALAFWSETMELVTTVDAPFEEHRWIMLEIPGARTQLHLDQVASLPERSRPALPLIAADVPGAIERLRERGVAIVAEPKPAEWDPETLYALIRDSEGNIILIASR